MKLTIKANGGINNVEFNKNTETGEIDDITIDFNTSNIWSDLELWLNNNNDDFLDYAKIIITKRKKMKLIK